MGTIMKYNNIRTINLNKIRPQNIHTNISNKSIKPYFENLEEKIVDYISNAKYIVGCAAWLTSDNVMNALDKTCGCKIIVNKEEFLNSNMEISDRPYYKSLRNKYHNLPDIFNVNCICCNNKILKCNNFNNIFGDLNHTDKKGAILTCGVVNNMSKMHHKFLIFFDEKMKPYGVWTGSYNLSKTSNYSLENALYITDMDVIMEYIKEFKVIYNYSEPHEWKSGILCKPQQ
ncbi:phospholipase D nuclease [Acanthamoeba polyphaga mimivirus]|uniref:Phospholipase D nuclease n=6 Tax=Megamimivirinae TaxID=3044648 RepID=A0A2L2DJA4_MIMIV|nr:phospholipase D-like domain-containing protein [Megavirus chiliensis]AEX61663.1 putative phospholipase D nuclease [Megavirus courdo7]AFX92570.1 putative phospholipase D/nuclease [Megavirus courdo11]AGD92436.1 putative phospholipase D/nuclease [Megavirus lba]AVG46244.1 phospholipase D nuclease [Acanthamoeba polyphaga mimivirus]AVL93838.1 putative phospholipase D/nuclease [Megavirus vitis]